MSASTWCAVGERQSEPHGLLAAMPQAAFRMSHPHPLPRAQCHEGREDYSETGQSAVDGFVDSLMEELDPDKDGVVSWAEFSEWNRRNSMEAELWKQAASVEDELRRQLRELGIKPRV